MNRAGFLRGLLAGPAAVITSGLQPDHAFDPNQFYWVYWYDTRDEKSGFYRYYAMPKQVKQPTHDEMPPSGRL